jgi:type IV secretion system protein VirB6
MLPQQIKNTVRNFTLFIAVFLFGWLVSTAAIANPVPNPSAPPAPAAAGNRETCTTFQERLRGNSTNLAGGGTINASSGILTEIYTFIKSVVDGAMRRVFNNFINNASYQYAVNAAAILMVVLFGVFFMIGVVQPSAGQVLIRLIKLGVVFSVVGPGGWFFFSETAVRFFNDGTDDLVRGIINITTGSSSAPGSSPFAELDKLGAQIIHPDTLKMIIGAITSGPYGMGMAALMGIGFAAFVKMLIDALRLYAISYVVRSLMLSLAPIFIVFLMFEKTKQLFIIWLNTLVSTMLQPVLMFLFLAFFIGMIDNASRNLFGTLELCWAEFDATAGSTNRISNYRFKDKDNRIITQQMTFEGPITCVLSGRTDCPEFPVNIVDLLTFVLLIFLASRFAEVVDRVANELSGTFVALDATTRMDQLINSQIRGGSSPSSPGR